MRQIGKVALGLVISYAALGPPITVSAHHTTQISRIESNPSRSIGPGDRKPGFAPSLGLTLSFAYFGATKSGDSKHAKSNLGQVWVEMTSLQGEIGLPTRGTLRLRFPFGVLRTMPANDAATTHLGLGDLSFEFEQPIWRGRLFGSEVSTGGYAGLSLPTGVYGHDLSTTATEVNGGENGTINLTTYDARATLGAGATVLFGGAFLQLSPSSSWRIQASTSLRKPLERTPDGVRWGADFSQTVQVRSAVTERFGWFGGANFYLHQKDHFSFLDDQAKTVTAKAGSRKDAGALAGIWFRASSSIDCQAQARLPVWQHFDGVQLAENVRMSLGCRTYLGGR